MFRKYKPSKAKAKEFANTMREIELFCEKNNISKSASSDSYYFTINDVNYRVSNHSIEASNKKSKNIFGETIRDKYHGDTRDRDTIYIHASKTRIIEIYNDIKAGYILDGRGNRKEVN